MQCERSLFGVSENSTSETEASARKKETTRVSLPALSIEERRWKTCTFFADCEGNERKRRDRDGSTIDKREEARAVLCGKRESGFLCRLHSLLSRARLVSLCIIHVFYCKTYMYSMCHYVFAAIHVYPGSRVRLAVHWPGNLSPWRQSRSREKLCSRSATLF